MVKILGKWKENFQTPNPNSSQKDWNSQTINEKNNGFLIAEQAPDTKQHMDFDAEIIDSKPVDNIRSILIFEFGEYRKKATFPEYPLIENRAKQSALIHSKVKIRLARGKDAQVIGFKFK